MSWLYVDSVLVIPTVQQPETDFVYYATKYENGGTVSNTEYVYGSYPDGNYAHIHCSDPPDEAWIVGTMNDYAHGNIEIYGYSSTDYYSNVYVYVSNDTQSWTQVGSMFTVTSNSPYWISAGSSSNSFKYIKIRGYGFKRRLYPCNCYLGYCLHS